MLINIRRILKHGARILFPRTCLVCGINDTWICQSCLLKLPPSSGSPLSWVRSVWAYQNQTVRKIIWFLKFKKRHGILEDIQGYVLLRFESFLKEKNLLGKNLLLIPVPITARSKHKRGYNQSTLIARTLVQRKPNMVVRDDILLKVINHLPQNKIKNRVARSQNVLNSCRSRPFQYETYDAIILIDDVSTTGATLLEARRALREHTRKNIFGFVLTH